MLFGKGLAEELLVVRKRFGVAVRVDVVTGLVLCCEVELGAVAGYPDVGFLGLEDGEGMLEVLDDVGVQLVADKRHDHAGHIDDQDIRFLAFVGDGHLVTH